ncbi:hypothetical protein AAVH_36766, partial [Aphelenchoides avenae]
FGMDQCSQCMADVKDMDAIDCMKCCCEAPPPRDAKGPNDEQMVHRCLELGPLGHCKQWTSGCTMDGRCPWTDQGERPIGKKGWTPITDIRNGPWTNFEPLCWMYTQFVGCYKYELRGFDNFVRRCLSVGPGDRCTEWTERCNVRGPCPWAYEERYGKESTY